MQEINHSVNWFSHQFPQQPVRYVAVVATDGVGRWVAKNNRSPGMPQHGPGCVQRSVGEVYHHSQPVHLLHHGLGNTFKNHFSSHFQYHREGRKSIQATTGDGYACAYKHTHANRNWGCPMCCCQEGRLNRKSIIKMFLISKWVAYIVQQLCCNKHTCWRTYKSNLGYSSFSVNSLLSRDQLVCIALTNFYNNKVHFP